MTSVNAVYNLPSIKHVLLIVPFFSEMLYSRMEHTNLLLGKQEVESILWHHHKKIEVENSTWQLKIALEADFLASIKALQRRLVKSHDPSFHSPVSLELLTISPIENIDSDYPLPSDLLRVLTAIPERDILEVEI